MARLRASKIHWLRKGTEYVVINIILLRYLLLRQIDINFKVLRNSETQSHRIILVPVLKETQLQLQKTNHRML